MLLACINILIIYLFSVLCRGKLLERKRLYSEHWETEANGKVKENYFII